MRISGRKFLLLIILLIGVPFFTGCFSGKSTGGILQNFDSEAITARNESELESYALQKIEQDKESLKDIVINSLGTLKPSFSNKTALFKAADN